MTIVRQVLSLLVFIMLAGNTSQAQDRSNENWFFGRAVRVDFATAPPTFTYFKDFLSTEASSALSDPRTGELILYSDGRKLLNGTHKELTTDATKLPTHPSSAQGVLILPAGCPHTYFVFTTDAGTYIDENIGAHYSLMDMNLNGGDGGFVAEHTNVQIMQKSMEGLNATHHNNRQAYWVIAHGIDDRRFHAFEVNKHGVKPAVISTVGPHLGQGNGYGGITSSPDGRKLVMFSRWGQVRLYDFNNSSGVISNAQELGITGLAYGAQFSPDSQTLYISAIQDADDGQSAHIYQYNLNSTQIVDTRFELYGQTVGINQGQPTAMQTGPDGRIYISAPPTRKIFRINSPNRFGAGADLEALDLPTGAESMLGMINLYTGPSVNIAGDAAPIELTLSDTLNICVGDSLRLQAGSSHFGNYSWSPRADLLDPDSQMPRVKPEKTTTYYVKFDGVCGSVTDSVTVVVNRLPILENLGIRTICRGGTLQLDIEGSEGRYSWSPQTGLDNPRIKQPTAQPETTTVYTVTLQTECGTISGQVEVKVAEELDYRLSSLEVCPGQVVSLNPDANPALEYVWDEAPEINDRRDVNPQVHVQGSRTFYLTVSDGECSQRDSVQVQIIPAPDLQLSRDSKICVGTSVELSAAGADEYEWSPAAGLSSTNTPRPVAQPLRTTMYYVRGIFDTGCERLDSVLVTVLPQAQVTIEPAQARFCSGESLQVNLLSDIALQSVEWTPQTGLNNAVIVDPTITLTSSQVYTVTYVSQDGCRGRIQYAVEVDPLPDLRVNQRNLTLCEGATGRFTAENADEYMWFDINGNRWNAGPVWDLPHNQPAGTYYVLGRNAAGCSDTVHVRLNRSKSLRLQAQREHNICFGDSLDLMVSGGDAATRYNWLPPLELGDPQSASTTAFPSESRSYAVYGSNSDGCEDSLTIQVNVAPRIELTLRTESANDAVLPGDEVDVHIDFRVSGPVPESGDLNEFTIVIDYLGESLQFLHAELRGDSQIEPWSITSIDQERKDALTFGVRGDGAALLPRTFSITLNMRVLLFSSLKNKITLGLREADFGPTLVCVEQGSKAEFAWSEMCLHTVRIITLNTDQFGISQFTPNPTHAHTEISFNLGFETDVQLFLTDALGRVVKTLVDARLPAGQQIISFDVGELASGHYRSILHAGPFRASRMLIIP